MCNASSKVFECICAFVEATCVHQSTLSFSCIRISPLDNPQLQCLDVPHKCGPCVFIHSFLPSFLPSFLRSFVPSFVRSFLRSFVPSFVPSFLPSFLPSFVRSFLRSFVGFLLLSFVRSFIDRCKGFKGTCI